MIERCRVPIGVACNLYGWGLLISIMSTPKNDLPKPDSDSGLDQPTMDQIGEEMRVQYRHSEPKPAYLGDRALPVEFERQLMAIERVEEIRGKGVAAVGDALKSAILHQDAGEPEPSSAQPPPSDKA
jgi:hypothetical protein